MNTVFPLGFPGPTALYLSLYVVTLAVHVLFMNYVLAGTSFLGLGALVAKLRGDRRNDLEPGTVRHALADWLPFAVGLAITAGVAPLLFLQILYAHRFYTANLLLFHRWMLIVPALIAGFYLLYLLKSDFAKTRPWVWTLAALGAFGCVAFTAWMWTENHLLSRDAEAWVPTYASGALVYRSSEVLPRLMMWFLGALSTMAMAVGWQLRAAGLRGHVPPRSQVRTVALLGMGGLVLGGLAAAAYASIAGNNVVSAATSPLALPWLGVTGIGAALQLFGWLRQLRRKDIHRADMVIITVGSGLALLGSGVVREASRLASIDLTALYAQHARAASMGGLPLFLVFLVVNGAIIAFAISVGAKASRLGEPDDEPS